MESTLKGSTMILSACCVAISGSFFLHKFYTSQQQQKPQVIKSKCTMLENLPTEIISEIISYLSVEDLVRCKSVWKQLDVNTKDEEFVERFMMRQTPYYFCNTAMDGIYLEEENSISRETLATCDGMKMKMKSTKYYEDLWRHSYYIKNPATQKVLEIPNPPIISDDNDYAFSFVSSTSEYKVTVAYKEYGKRKCALLTLGTYENKWRILDVPGGNCVYSHFVQTGTVVHCVRGYDYDSDGTFEISSLDLETECFSITNVEKSFITTRTEIMATAINWNGVFSFAYIEGDELKVLILEDYKTQKWADRFTIYMNFMNEKSYINRKIYPDSADNGMIWFALYRGFRLRFDPNTGKVVQKIRGICDYNGPYIYGKVFSLKPSYIILKGMHPPGEKSIYSLMTRSLSTSIAKVSYYLREPFRSRGEVAFRSRVK